MSANTVNYEEFWEHVLDGNYIMFVVSPGNIICLN